MAEVSAWVGFAYGEHLEGSQPRSLGFRLLIPTDSQPWSNEVETLARRLQAAPYPEHWPATDLFCSVLLANGLRLIAVARYGLDDHTPSRRRGGMELFGVIGPKSIQVKAALAIYVWLKNRRNAQEDLSNFAGKWDLVTILAEAPTPPSFSDPLPVLPVQLWQEGALLFAATTPNDPDLRLGMLEDDERGTWQWLPLTGADFPLASFTQRGPVVAWTPHLTGVAVHLGRNSDRSGLVPPPISKRNSLTLILTAVIALLLLGNLWYLRRIDQRLADKPPESSTAVSENNSSTRTKVEPGPVVSRNAPDNYETIAKSLYVYLLKNGHMQNMRQEQLLKSYDRVVAGNEELRVTSPEARMCIGAFAELSRRKSAAQIESLIRSAGNQQKGLDPDVVTLIAQRVYQKMTEAGE